jgi:hypothetical protein
LPINLAGSPVLPLELAVRDPRVAGGLVTGAAAAAAGAADARFAVEIRAGNQGKADPVAFLTHRARAAFG